MVDLAPGAAIDIHFPGYVRGIHVMEGQPGNPGAPGVVQSVNGQSVEDVVLDADDVDAAANTGGGREQVAALSATIGTATGNCAAASVFTVTPTGNLTLAFINVPVGVACTVTVIVTQGGTIRTVALPAGGVWIGPAPLQAANKKSVINLLTVDGGTTWLCFGGVEQ